MLTLFDIPAWQVFTLLAFAFVVMEAFIPGLVMFPTGIALGVTALASALLPQWAWVLLVFAVAELGMVWVFKNYSKGISPNPSVYTNAEGMVGKEALVVEAIPSGKGGYVKLYGDQWAAYSHCGRDIDLEEKVVIARVDGNKVWVDPINE